MPINCQSYNGNLKIFQLIEVEDDFISVANSDIAQLCAENILLWQQFLETFTCKDPVHQHLAKNHHQLRVIHCLIFFWGLMW